MYHAAALTMPGAVIQIPTQPLIDSEDHQHPPGLVHALPIRVQRRLPPPSFLPQSHDISPRPPTPPPPTPFSTSPPASILAETHGRVFSNDLMRPDEQEENRYTELEETFLRRIALNFEGRGEIEDAIEIPDEFEEGSYLEAIGAEGRVSLRFPRIEALFARAARTWPDTPFGLFNRTTMSAPPGPYKDMEEYLRIPSPTNSSDESTSSSSLEYDWQYPESPTQLPPIELPVLQLRMPDTEKTDHQEGSMEICSENARTANCPPIVAFTPRDVPSGVPAETDEP